MRLVGTINDERQAAVFADYLMTIEIRARVDASGSHFEVWIYDEDHVQRGAEELASFVQNPSDPRYVEAGPAALGGHHSLLVGSPILPDRGGGDKHRS